MRLVELRVRCDDAAPAAARRALIQLDPSHPVVEDLMLIASELVTNAVLYSGCTEEDEIEVLLDQADSQVVLSVVDPGRSGQCARMALSEQRASGGMGLPIVDQLARRWGTERSDRYRVWAEVTLTPEGRVA